MKIIILAVLIMLSACAKQPPQNKTAAPADNAKIQNTEEKSPQYIAQEICIGEANTEILDSSKNRVFNIQRAIENVSGCEIKSENIFSFNEKTGPRTKENGYKTATVIIDGEHCYDYGGGVCQLSTTIYKAAIAGGLEIKERYSHTKPVAYAPDGSDATVVYGAKDLRIKNNTGKTLLIYAWIQENKIYVKIIEKDIDNVG